MSNWDPKPPCVAIIPGGTIGIYAGTLAMHPSVEHAQILHQGLGEAIQLLQTTSQQPPIRNPINESQSTV